MVGYKLNILDRGIQDDATNQTLKHCGLNDLRRDFYLISLY